MAPSYLALLPSFFLDLLFHLSCRSSQSQFIPQAPCLHVAYRTTHDHIQNFRRREEVQPDISSTPSFPFSVASLKMPETQFYTLNHEVPNGALPPGTMFAQAINFPIAGHQDITVVDNGPPNGGLPPDYGRPGPPPPPYHAPTIGISLHMLSPSPVTDPSPVPSFTVFVHPAAPPTPSPAPTITPNVKGTMGAFPGLKPWSTPAYSHSQGPFYEPPGQYVDGHIMHGNGWSYITPADNTTIFFIGGGLRPCDFPNGHYAHKFAFSKHKAPCSMTVRDLMKRLGCPDGMTKGLTEIGSAGGGHWVALDSFTQGGEASNQTLEKVGWTKERGENNPVWLVVKR